MLRTVVCLLLLLACRGDVHAVVVEQISAVVNDNLIFRSDLERHHLFFEAFQIEEVHSASQRIHHLIDEHLLDVEARRFIPNPPTDAEVDVQMGLIRLRFQDSSFQNALQSVGWSEAGLKEEVRRHLWIEQLLHERVSSFIFVSQKMVEEYDQAHRDQSPNRPESDVQQEIRDRLRTEKETEKRQDYLRRLREQAIVRINPQ